MENTDSKQQNTEKRYVLTQAEIRNRYFEELRKPIQTFRIRENDYKETKFNYPSFGIYVK